MGWAAKFGAGFFQGTAASFPGAFQQAQNRKRQEEEQQSATYIDLLNQTETPEESNAILSQVQADVNLSPAAKRRLEVAAKGLGQVREQQFQRETKATIGETHELSDVAIGGADSTSIEDYKGTPERLRAQGEKLSALALLNPKLREDPDFQAAQTKLNIGLEQTSKGRAGAEEAEQNKLVWARTIQDMVDNPETRPEVLHSKATSFGYSPTQAQTFVEAQLANKRRIEEERVYKRQEDERNFAQQQALNNQDLFNRQRVSADAMILNPDIPDSAKQPLLKMASPEVVEAYLRGGTASGIPEIDRLPNDPFLRQAVWKQLSPEVRATASPGYGALLTRQVNAKQISDQYKSQEDLDRDIVRAGALEIARTGLMTGVDGSPPDVVKVGEDIGRFTAAYYRAKAQGDGDTTPEEAEESFYNEFTALGGTASAAQQVYDKIRNGSASPDVKARVLSRLSDRNAAFTPLLIQFNQEATAPAPEDSGLTLGQGLALGGAVAVAGGLEIAANKRKNGNALFPQGRMPLPWEQQSVGEGSVIAKSMAQDSRPGLGERSVVMPEPTAYNPNAPPPAFRGEGRFGNAPPEPPIPTTPAQGVTKPYGAGAGGPPPEVPVGGSPYGPAAGRPGLPAVPLTTTGVPVGEQGPGLSPQQQQFGKGPVPLTEGQRFFTPQAAAQRATTQAEIEAQRQRGAPFYEQLPTEKTATASPAGYRGMEAPAEDLDKMVQRAKNLDLISEGEAKDFLLNKNGEEKLRETLTRRLKINPNNKGVKRILRDLGAKTPGAVSAFLAVPVLLQLAEESKERNITGFELFNSLFGPSAAE